MLILGLALLPFHNAPDWLLILFAILLGLSVAIFLASYIYFALKNPDALRSERFTLSKMAIEKNLIGDDVAGLVELDDVAEPRITAIPHYKDEGAAK